MADLKERKAWSAIPSSFDDLGVLEERDVLPTIKPEAEQRRLEHNCICPV